MSPLKELPVFPGRRWRSLEELASSSEFERGLPDEFAQNTIEGFDRRDLFKFMGASLALAGLTSCTRQPTERIVPYVRQPEEIVPGKPLFYATAMTLGGSATGLLVESHMGRPTKVEGNPLHPASLGATDRFSQASIYDLYDPDRSQTLLELEEIRPWATFLGAMRTAVEAERGNRGAGLRILTGSVSSPTLVSQLESLLAELPAAKWVQWEAAGRDNALAGARMAFGDPVDPVFEIEQAAVILSLGSDFLGCGPGHLRHARHFAARRRAMLQAAAAPEVGTRLYVVESTATITGANADHRRAARSSEIEGLARAVSAALGEGRGGEDAGGSDPFVAALAADLAAHRGASLVLAGDEQPPAVHLLAHAMNAALGNVGRTVRYIEPVAARPSDQLASLEELVADMGAGRVRTLLILGGNPAFDAPADLNFAGRLERVPLRVHLSSHHDETSALCHWHVPEAHYLEAWSDARAFDGTASIVQPLIAPLYQGKSAHEVLAALSANPEQRGYEVVRATWQPRLGPDFETSWRRALHDGVIAGTASQTKSVSLRASGPSAIDSPPARAEPAASTVQRSSSEARPLEIVFRPDPAIHDGRFANNGWLQETPRPLTKLTWDNAALLSLADAARLGLAKEDLVELRFRGRTVRAPVWIEPGLPEGSVTVHFGAGRRRAGRLGSRAGFDAYALRPSGAIWGGEGLEIRKTGTRYPLACTQLHQNMEGREIVRAATLSDYRKNPGFVHEIVKEPAKEESLYPEFPSMTYAWGMAIDLSSCVGCNACVVACQAENNIPVVGKDQVRRGREMHWIRVDHYYEGDPADPEHFFQPLPCMHCETAPCEVVCPVAATVHSAEGLNDMVYNRCVGTKYCSNNCPYKVRRFNFYHYSTQFRAPSMKMLANPDVTVRWRGVMEKCTYCVQRINGAKIQAELEDRRVRDGDVTTACAQACPAEAIVFGDLADPASRVSALRRDVRSYGLLGELGTRPRTTYLGAVRNPSPALPRSVHAPRKETAAEEETGQK